MKNSLALAARNFVLVLSVTGSAGVAPVVVAQEMDHSKMDHSKMQMPAAPAPPEKAPPKKKPSKAAPPKPTLGKPSTKAADAVDHSAMGHTMPLPEPVDHSAMGHSMPTEAPVDHSAMGHSMPPDAPVDHASMGHSIPSAPTEPREPIPVVSDADRQAAFPVVHGHEAHDRAIHSFWLIDRLEAWESDDGTGIGWEGLAWIGGDINRVWLRSEGEVESGDTRSGDVEVLYGRSISPWWDLVAGVRHDFSGGPGQDFAAIGLVGLSPYKFEIDATAYIGQSGQTALRLEAEYDTLITNRLILQWQAEVELFGKDDPLRSVGAGLSTVEAGLRLRYEITRQFAPYIGVAWEGAYGRTADYRRNDLETTSGSRVVAGFRIWF